jgi:toxin ParE1/3/4
VKVRWTDRALRDLAAVFDYVAEDNEGAAARLADRLLEAASRLGDMPLLGRPAEGGRRVLVVDRFLLFYRVAQGEARIVSVIHASRRKR